MFNTGISAASRSTYYGLLASHHSIEVQVRLLDMNHNQVSDVSARLLDGQVTFDSAQDISRGLTLSLLDPSNALHLDSKSPDAGAVFADRMVQVRYTVINPTGNFRVTCPVFTGPITKLDRTGAVVSIEAQGKESLGLTRPWSQKTYKKGWHVTAAVQDILRKIMGENKYAIPATGHRLPRNVSVGGDQLPWKVAKSLAHSIGYQLYYDGMGVARMRKIPQSTSWTFHEGAGGTVLSEPQVGFSMEGVRNAIEVWGKKPDPPKKGHTAKKRPHARVVASRSHPLSPWALGRSTGPRYLPEVLEEDAITTNSQALARAKERLKSALLESVSVTFDALVVPPLEEWDIVRISSSKFAATFRLTAFALPLNAQAKMSVGYVRRLTPNKSLIRKK